MSKPFSREALAAKMRHVLDAPAPAMPGAATPPRERPSILVVEDDTLVRLTTPEMLADLGHGALEAGA
ncbi:hypothetical protein GAY33_29565 [Azospirillum brasilense]|uniref:hypothetical protein n=1 Tax=Azospirillum argentinense TaxID=2970906 RepID=UPI00190E78DB|nr:hypothetical protein [Azospirillum argentinense]MBK3803291.1 hypothetical protein [Azospirillum argentinense]